MIVERRVIFVKMIHFHHSGRLERMYLDLGVRWAVGYRILCEAFGCPLGSKAEAKIQGDSATWSVRETH